MTRWMDVQTVYSYYTELVSATNMTVAIAVIVTVDLAVAFLVFEVIAVIRKVRAGRSLTSALVVPSAQPPKTQSLPVRKKVRPGKPNFFIPELGVAGSEDVLKTVSVSLPVSAATSVPDGEDILSDMYAEKVAVISMLNSLREELVASKSNGAISAIDVLTADIQRRDVNSIWQLGASRIAEGTK